MPDEYEHRWTCESCGAHMSASDSETLQWGIDEHVCFTLGGRSRRLRGFEDTLRGESEREDLEELVVCWLVGTYRRPFWWFRVGEIPLVVT